MCNMCKEETGCKRIFLVATCAELKLVYSATNPEADSRLATAA